MTKNKPTDGIIGIGLFILSVIMYFIIIPNQIANVEYGAGSLLPSFFPKVAIGIIGVLSILLIVEGFVYNRQGQQSLSFGPKALSIILFLIGYAIGIEIIGYLAATGIFLFALMLYLSRENWGKYLVIIVIFLAVNYLFFEKMLNLVLPRGYLFE
ncbi:MAG: tripartite tricarboxylate transporter TctB family protein [Pseudomonadota bacterium]